MELPLCCGVMSLVAEKRKRPPGRNPAASVGGSSTWGYVDLILRCRAGRLVVFGVPKDRVYEPWLVAEIGMRHRHEPTDAPPTATRRAPTGSWPICGVCVEIIIGGAFLVGVRVGRTRECATGSREPRRAHLSQGGFAWRRESSGGQATMCGGRGTSSTASSGRACFGGRPRPRFTATITPSTISWPPHTP